VLNVGLKHKVYMESWHTWWTNSLYFR